MAASTLGYALLGLLAREALSGYDLAARLGARVGYFWQAGHSQIYPELARLEAAGLVGHIVVPQADRPAKKVYAPTAAGRAALVAWLISPLQPATPRDELVLRTYSIWLADPRAAAPLFREQGRLHAARQAEYEAIVRHLDGEYGPALRRPGSIPFASFAALQRGIGREREYAAWCVWMADSLLQAAAEADAPPAPADPDPGRDAGPDPA